MQVEQAKPAYESTTYTCAGWAKKLSLFATVLGSISTVTFLGAPALGEFLPPKAVSKIQAASTIVTALSTAIAASQSGKAQIGRLNARAVVYTPDGQRGLNRVDAPSVVIPRTPDETRRLTEVTPFIEGAEIRPAVGDGRRPVGDHRGPGDLLTESQVEKLTDWN